jgi:hypothetical protein
MKRVKISIAAIAFAFAIGGTFIAKSSTVTAPDDCAVQIGDPGTLNSATDCDHVNEATCCFLVSNDQEIRKSAEQ